MVVAAPHREAEAAGAAILAEGGNAIEAAIAVASSLGIVYPHMTGLGGDSFWLIAEPGKPPVGLQACGPAARAATVERYRSQGHGTLPTRGGDAALTVAGAVNGWAQSLELSKTWGGTLPLARLLADARRFALQGVSVTRSQATLTRSKWDELSALTGFREAFAPGAPPAEGDLLVQTRVAAVLDQLAHEGLDGFYRGDLARTLAADLEAVGSPLVLDDLSAYRASWVTPLSVSLSVGTVWNLPPPTQGVSSLAILGLFDRLGVTKAEGFDHLHGLVEATKKAFAWRNRHVGDPARMTASAGEFLSPASLEALTASMDRKKATVWPEVEAPGDTVWFGVIDAQGRAVSVIQSLYWEFGAGMVLPTTGLLWQNRGSSFSLASGANQLEPGRLPFHTLNPALARLNDGRTVAYGTMGGEGQPQTQAAFLTRYAWFGHGLAASFDAPRWLLGRTWGEDTAKLRLESRFDPALVKALENAGHEVELVAAYDDRMGHAGAVVHHVNGLTEAAHDPRADGGGLAVTHTAPWQLERFLSTLATFGAQPGGGVTRLLYDDAWGAARTWMAAEWIRMGFEVRDDRVGNLYGRLEPREHLSKPPAPPKPTAPSSPSSGRSEDGFWQAAGDAKTGAYPSVREDLSEPEAPPKPTAVVLTGSHFDTVRDGGWYDGAYGVAASAVALADLVRRHGPPLRPVEVVAFCEEEGSRFPLAYWGSGHLAGRWPEGHGLSQKDRSGTTLDAAMKGAGFGKPDQPDPRRTDLAAFVEVHVEQGIVLERSGDRISVVEAIVGQRRWLVGLTGEANHAGTTPMDLRRDALAGAVEMMALVEAEARRRGAPLVATVGFVEVGPNTPNVVPGTCAFTVDARHTRADDLAAFCSFLEAEFAATAARRGLGYTLEPRMAVDPAPLDQALRSLILKACLNQGLSCRSLPSGAGHDAQVMAGLCPTAMIFVPSRKGISHSPLESSTHQALADGLAVLTDVLYELAWKGPAP